MVVGDLLARWRDRELDHRASGIRVAACPGFLGSDHPRVAPCAGMDIFFRVDLGHWRPDVWVDDAVPGPVLGYAIALGFCAAFGTLIPPLFTGEFGKIVGERWGQITLGGIFVCLVGIFVSGMAGMSKERELSAEQKRASVREFNFLKGLAVAVFCGIMSATIAFAFAAGQPIADVAAERLVSARTGYLAEITCFGRGALGRIFIQFCMVRRFEHAEPYGRGIPGAACF